jgi:hypothetical protein
MKYRVTASTEALASVTRLVILGLSWRVSPTIDKSVINSKSSGEGPAFSGGHNRAAVVLSKSSRVAVV